MLLNMDKKELGVGFGEYEIGAYNELPITAPGATSNVAEIRNSTQLRGGIIFTAYDKSTQIGAMACIDEQTPITIIDSCLGGLFSAGVNKETLETNVWAKTNNRDRLYSKEENELLEKITEKYKDKLTCAWYFPMDHCRNLVLYLENGTAQGELGSDLF